MENNALFLTTGKEVNIIIRASNSKILKTVVNNFVKSLKKKKDSIALTISSLKCGCKRQYRTIKDIPNKSIKCKHGIWFIKYDNKKVN